jgi:high frequency lysogenization protein
MKDRTMALAGIFQATELVRQAANHGTWSGYAAETCVDSLLAIEADTVDEIYGGRPRLRLGAETLVSILQGDRRHMESLGYAVSIMQLETHFRKNTKMQSKVGNELLDIANFEQTQIEHDGIALEEHEIRDLQAEKIATLYAETISTISPRIVVNGKPQHLQVPRTVNWVRTLLFSGLRSAVLWRQLGGGRFSLMFGRKKMLEQAQMLLSG